MRIFSKCKINTLFLLLSLTGLVWADEMSIEQVPQEAVSASDANPVIWYACPLLNNHVNYTTSPLDVQCQVAKHPPADSNDIKVRSLEKINVPSLEQLQRLWYSAEFGQNSDLMKVPSIPKLGIHLRQQDANKINGGVIRKNKAIPAKIITPPKLTPKQMIQRDINSEQRALVLAQKQLSQAQKRGSAIQIQRWQQNVTDRQANIRVLKQELSRY